MVCACNSSTREGETEGPLEALAAQTAQQNWIPGSVRNSVSIKYGDLGCRDFSVIKSTYWFLLESLSLVPNPTLMTGSSEPFVTLAPGVSASPGLCRNVDSGAHINPPHSLTHKWFKYSENKYSESKWGWNLMPASGVYTCMHTCACIHKHIHIHVHNILKRFSNIDPHCN